MYLFVQVGRTNDAKTVIRNLWGESEVERAIDEFQAVIKDDGSDVETRWLELLEEPHFRGCVKVVFRFQVLRHIDIDLLLFLEVWQLLSPLAHRKSHLLQKLKYLPYLKLYQHVMRNINNLIWHLDSILLLRNCLEVLLLDRDQAIHKRIVTFGLGCSCMFAVAFIGGSLFVLQQFAGINGVLYFSSLTFQDVGISSSALASLLVGVTNFAGLRFQIYIWLWG